MFQLETSMDRGFSHDFPMILQGSEEVPEELPEAWIPWGKMVGFMDL